MRCLFCGKDLPLFKRLTGGEFCSDAHRQQYQQEYSQLALKRLLQAQLPEDPKKQDDKTASAIPSLSSATLGTTRVPAATPAPGARPAPAGKLAPNAPPALTSKFAQATRPLAEAKTSAPPAAARGAFAAKPAPPLPPKPSAVLPPAASVARNGTPKAPDAAVAAAQPPPAAKAAPLAKVAPPRKPEAIAPAAVAGPVEYRPAAAKAKAASPAMPETEIVTSVHPEIPRNGNAPLGVRLESADRVSYDAIAHPPEMPWRARHDRLEVRDFARANPVLDLGVKLEEPRMETATEPAELSFLAAHSRTEASPWVQAQREFGVGQVQIGELATLDLPTTGFEISVAADPIVAAEPSPGEKTSLPESIAPAPAAPPDSPTPPASRDPEPVTQPMPIVVQGIPAGKAKPVQIFTSTLRADAAAQIPRYDTLPLRPKMVLGRADAPFPKTEPAKIEPAMIEPAKTQTAKIESVGPGAKTASAPISGSAPARPATVNPVAELAPKRPSWPAASPVETPAATPTAKNPAPANTRPAVSSRWATKTNAAGTPAPPARAAAAEPKPKTEPKPSRDLPEPGREQTEVAWEQTKLNREQAELNRQQADLNRQQAELIREQARTAPKAADASASPAAPPSGPAPAASTAVETKPAAAVRPAPAPTSPAAGPASATALNQTKAGPKKSLSLNAPSGRVEENDLGLPQLDLNKVKKPLPLWVKITAAAACVLLLTGGIWFFASHNRAEGPETMGIGSLSAGAGPEWIENFSPDAKHPRTISVLRESAGLSDYTVEFSASVDVKALGWVFRAKDAANFYVARIEQEKTLGGTVAGFVYFPVVGGVPQEPKRSPVALPAVPGTVYKIRFEASGERFTAWIQDRKVEEWTDGRLLSGGAGLYSESGERALLQGGFRVIPETAGK
jgi:hypothetical protein